MQIQTNVVIMGFLKKENIPCKVYTIENMFTLEINCIDFRSLVFSFDKGGIENFIFYTDYLRNNIEHQHFLRGVEFDDTNHSGNDYSLCDFFNISHVPEYFMETDSKIEINYDKYKKSAIEILFSKKGINCFLDKIVSLSKENSLISFEISSSIIYMDDEILCENCIITVMLKFLFS